MQHVFKGDGLPTFAPTAFGQHYVDTQHKVVYDANDTASVEDWVLSGQWRRWRWVSANRAEGWTPPSW